MSGDSLCFPDVTWSDSEECSVVRWIIKNSYTKLRNGGVDRIVSEEKVRVSLIRGTLLKTLILKEV